MLENAFIKLSTTQQDECGIALPIKFGGSPIYFNTINEVEGTSSTISLLNRDGDEIIRKNVQHDSSAYPLINIAGQWTEQQISSLLDEGECFKIKINSALTKSDSGMFITNDTNGYETDDGRIANDFSLLFGLSYAGKPVHVQITITIDTEHRYISVMRLYRGGENVGISEDGVNIIADFNAVINEDGRIPLTWVWDVPYSYIHEMSTIVNTHSEIMVAAEDVPFYSNMLKFVKNTDGLSTIRYSCKEDAFGFPFATTGEQSVLLPINIKNLQLKTKDEVYTNLKGENIILYSTVTNEYDFETEYLTQDIHRKIVIALSCDHVWIDDMPVYKSGEYSIDWDNKTELDCGEKIAKATSKVQQNSNSRNSN